MGKTYSYNGACFLIDRLYSGSKAEYHSPDNARTEFFVDGRLVARYNETTGELDLYNRPKRRCTGMRTLHSSYRARTEEEDIYNAEGRILARQESWGIYD